MKNISEKAPSKSTHKGSAKSNSNRGEELKTDPPISEKDEVKKAEQNTQKNIRR